MACTLSLLLPLMNHQQKILPFKNWFPLDHKNNDFIYWGLVVYQYVLSLYGSVLNYSLDLITIIFVSFLSTTQEELSKEISTLNTTPAAGDLLKRLENCIECHKRVQSFTKEMSKNLSLTFLIQAYLSSVILCTSAFMITTVNIFFIT